MSQTKTNYYLIICSIVITTIAIIYGTALSVQGIPNLRVLPWSQLLIILPGIPFLLPGKLQAFNHQIPSINKPFIVPILAGLLFGLADLLIIEGIINTKSHEVLPPYTQPFPYSILLYFSGAIEIEFYYRLIPLSVMMLIAYRIKSGNYSNWIFYSFACLLSLIEPIQQFVQFPLWFSVYSFLSGFGMNFYQAVTLRNQGFWTALSIRLAHYLIWHILNGIIIEWSL